MNLSYFVIESYSDTIDLLDINKIIHSILINNTRDDDPTHDPVRKATFQRLFPQIHFHRINKQVASGSFRIHPQRRYCHN